MSSCRSGLPCARTSASSRGSTAFAIRAGASTRSPKSCRWASSSNRPTGTLSAGQKTRASLAKALVNEPEVLLLDEPTASLDPDTGDWVRAYLERYVAERKATILLASHNMSEVERMASFVLMMKAGKLVDRGTAGELLKKYGRENLEDVFLDIARDRRRAKEPEGLMPDSMWPSFVSLVE